MLRVIRGGPRTLATTLVLAFVLVTALALLISSSLELYFNFETQQKIVLVEQQVISQNAASEVRQFVESKFSSLETAAQLGDLNTGEQESVRIIFGKLVGRDPSLRSLFLTDTAGNEIVSLSRASTPSVPTSKEVSGLISQIAKTGRYVSPVHFDDTTSEPRVYLAVPVKNVFGDSQRVIIADLNLKFMWDVVRDIQTSTGRTTYVVDDAGNLLAHFDTGLVLQRKNLSSLVEVGEFLKGVPDTYEEELFKSGIQGDTVISTHANLITPNWSVIIELPAATAFAPVIQLVLESIWVVIGAIVLSILLAIYLSRLFTKPLTELTKATHEIAAGNLGTLINSTSQNEIGQLAHAFDDMRLKIKEGYENLDSKVKEKTTELSTKLDELERMNKFMVDRELKMIELKKEIAAFTNTK